MKVCLFLPCLGLAWTATAWLSHAGALDPGSFTVSTGLTASRAITKGLVKHPMMATLDDQGRLFVAESSGGNLNKEELLEEKPHSIKLLADTDGDGVFDQATTFADEMTFPQGALWIYDSLYVMSPPGLWELQDADGDGIAEKRAMIVSGFDFTGNAADVHGPFLHPNGRLFWCHGRKGHEVIDKRSGEVISKGRGARIWSCQIDGSDVRAHAGGGLDNPVELDFTETGEIIGTANLFYGKPRGDVLVHWLHGGAYPRIDQGAVLSEFKRTGPLLGEIHNFGHAAVSGMCRYRSGTLNPEWKDQWLVAHFNSSQITRTRLRREGSTFAAEETAPVFQLNLPNSHLTDVLEDRNGDLLVIDTGGWFRNGCPTSQVARPDVPGGIYRIAKAGEPYQKAEFPTPKEWEGFDPIQVAEKLKSDKGFIRDRTVTEFAVRGDPSIPEIRLILEDPESTADARRNCVWALARMRFSDSPDLITLALKDPDPSVQVAACNAVAATRSWQQIAQNEANELIYELERNKTISGALAGLVRAGEPEVARNAAVALGAMAEVRSIGSLFGRAGREDVDRALQHAIIYSLIEMEDPEPLLETLRNGNPAQQVAAIWALEGIPDYQLGILDVVLYLDSEDEALRDAVAGVAKRHPEWDGAIANQFYLFTDELTPQKIDQILELGPAFSGTPPMLSFVGYLLHHENREVANLARELLPRFSSFEFQEDWKDPFLKWLDDKESRAIALDCLANTATDLFDGKLAAMAEDETNSPVIRIKALQAKSGKDKGNAALPSSAFDLVASILKSREDASLRSRAIRILEDSALTPEQNTEIARLLDRGGPVELPRLFNLFRTIPDEDLAKILAETLPQSPGFGALGMAELREKFSGFDSGIRDAIERAIAKREEERRNQKESIDSLVADLSKGDPERGKELFHSGKGACVTCHKIGDLGKEVGPDLSKVANIRKPVDLVESILYPGASIAGDFESYLVTLNDGSRVLGVIHEEMESSVSLAAVTGSIQKLDPSPIKEIENYPESLMPAGLEQSMSRGELLDLVSYLMTLR